MNSTTSPQSLLHQAAQLQRMERGKLSIIRHGPEGPYYNHQCRCEGKNVSRYVPRDQVPAVQEAIEAYSKFNALIEQYVDQIVEQTRSEIAVDAKKKTPPRKSSWPKSKRSSS